MLSNKLSVRRTKNAKKGYVMDLVGTRNTGFWIHNFNIYIKRKSDAIL